MVKQAESTPILDTNEVDALATLVEEATRDTADAPRRFIEPARGTLDRAKSRRHHLIFGRRGSGKTSLLLKAKADLSADRIPASFIDLESFKGHSYPDVLLSILIKTFEAFDKWFATAGRHPASKTAWWQKLAGQKPRKPPLNKSQVEMIRQKLKIQSDELKVILHSSDNASLRERIAMSSETQTRIVDGFEVKGAGLHIKASDEDALTTQEQREVTEESKRNKTEFLHRRIIEYQTLFDEIITVANSSAYIFLDDLYHIRRTDQPYVLDYFHRIVKGRNTWLKVGTIRHRTDWYRHGDPPIGLKLGDDADDIDLDITLEKYELARRFLLSVLENLIKEAGIDSYEKVLVEGAVQRLVLASGGVARDFLTIFRRSIDVARERGVDYRGPRVTAEDINGAAGEHDASKRDELKRDTLEGREQLELALSRIQEFCVERKVNCFLVKADRDTPGTRSIGELVDLRFLHSVKSRLTVRDRPKELFTAYMLDISQYTGARKRRELQMTAFWKPDQLDRLRRARYVLDAEKLFSNDTDQTSS